MAGIVSAIEQLQGEVRRGLDEAAAARRAADHLLSLRRGGGLDPRLRAAVYQALALHRAATDRAGGALAAAELLLATLQQGGR